MGQQILTQNSEFIESHFTLSMMIAVTSQKVREALDSLGAVYASAGSLLLLTAHYSVKISPVHIE